MMTPREVVTRTIRFQTPDRLGHDFVDLYENDFVYVACDPWVDARPPSGPDQWGRLGEPGHHDARRGQGIPPQDVGRP